MENKDEDFIVFDNLVQADSTIAGDDLPVKARKAAGSERQYAQANASGEPYRPADLNDVQTRAVASGKRFNNLFDTETTR
jgi:hypothetical protein